MALQEYADKIFFKDKEVVLAAVKNYWPAYEYADESFLKDKEVVLEILNKMVTQFLLQMKV